jgi:hypothetical protein
MRELLRYNPIFREMLVEQLQVSSKKIINLIYLRKIKSSIFTYYQLSYLKAFKLLVTIIIQLIHIKLLKKINTLIIGFGKREHIKYLNNNGLA